MYLKERWEALADGDIRGPIDEHGQANRGRAWRLREQLGHNEPRDGARADRKEHNVQHHGDHAQILDVLVFRLQNKGDCHQNAKDKHAAEAEQVQEASTGLLHQRN